MRGRDLLRTPRLLLFVVFSGAVLSVGCERPGVGTARDVLDSTSVPSDWVLLSEGAEGMGFVRRFFDPQGGGTWEDIVIPDDFHTAPLLGSALGWNNVGHWLRDEEDGRECSLIVETLKHASEAAAGLTRGQAASVRSGESEAIRLAASCPG